MASMESSTKYNVPFDGFHYHPHQVEAIAWMISRERNDASFVRGGILADEMGLGKTWMTMGLLLNTPVSHTLLLVPPALQPQWSDALTQAHISHRILGARGFGPIGPLGPDGKEVEVEVEVTRYVTLATYDRAAGHRAILAATPYDRIVCDEGHIFRNGATNKRFRELVQIPAKCRWILSGTPVQNKKRDFWNLMNFLGMDGAERLRRDISVVAAAVLLRRTVGMVRDAVPTMPVIKPIHIVHPVVMPTDSEESRVFASLVGRFEHAVDRHANGLIILELYLRIRQFTAHPAIYVSAMKRKYGDTYGRAAWTHTASKMAAFRDTLDTLDIRPTIVFGTFSEELDYAEATLRSAGYTVWSIRGGMTDARRERVIQESRAAAAEGTPVALVIQIIAGGAGLNLQHCSRVMFLSSHWNPAVVDQAIARAYRMGQTETVEVHHFLLADGADRNVDRRMAYMHGIKRLVATGIHPLLFCDTAVDDSYIECALESAVSDDVMLSAELSKSI